MADVRVSGRVDSAAVRALVREAAEKDLRRRGQRVLNAAKTGCPVDEGRLKNSLALELVSGPGGVPVARIGTNLPYAIFVHEGTGVYAGNGPITPKRASVLRWPVKNNSGSGRRRYKAGKTAGFAFAKSVKGVPARPFLRNALDAARY